MADIDADPTTMSTHGHTMPVSKYQGSAPLKAGMTVTVGSANQEWEVARIDPPDGDDPEPVFHIHRP
jgi:hypothetical protein